MEKGIVNSLAASLGAKGGAIAIVQARMGSTRLPAKVLKEIAGWPLIKHVIHRLRGAKSINRIVIATTHNAADDALVTWLEKNEPEVAIIRGPEDDVLARYGLAVRAHDPATIIRVNADAPLIDGAFIDHILRVMRTEETDFVMSLPGEPCIHDGVDVCSRRGFEILLREGGDDPVAREHVTAWFKAHQDRVRVSHIRIPDPWRFSGARLSVDAPADVAFIETIYARLHAQAGEASLADLVALLRRDPALLAINGHVRQKSVVAQSGTILIRCDGSPKLGYGHVMRMLALAEALRDAHGFGAVFAIAPDAEAQSRIAAQGFPVLTQPPELEEAAWLSALLAGGAPRALILDVRTKLSRADVMRLRRIGALIATIDDGSDRRLAADLSFLPPVPQARALLWRGAVGEALMGWQWTLQGAAPITRIARTPDAPLRVLVTMGGSDPASQTLIAARAIAALGDAVEGTVVIGPGVIDADGLAAALAALSPRPRVVRAPETLAPLIAASDVALAAYGVTAFELASAGVPAILIALTDDHAQSASALDACGTAELAGLAGTLTSADLEARLRALIADPQRLHDMSAAGRTQFDGQGAARIAARITSALETRKLSMRA